MSREEERIQREKLHSNGEQPERDSGEAAASPPLLHEPSVFPVQNEGVRDLTPDLAPLLFGETDLVLDGFQGDDELLGGFLVDGEGPDLIDDFVVCLLYTSPSPRD